MPKVAQIVTATIASGGTNSAAVPLDGQKIMAVFVPTCDSTTLKVQCSHDGTNFYDMEDTSGNTVGSFSAQVFNCYLDGDTMARFMGVKYIRFVAGTAQTSGAVDIKVTVSQE